MVSTSSPTTPRPRPPMIIRVLPLNDSEGDPPDSSSIIYIHAAEIENDVENVIDAITAYYRLRGHVVHHDPCPSMEAYCRLHNLHTNLLLPLASVDPDIIAEGKRLLLVASSKSSSSSPPPPFQPAPDPSGIFTLYRDAPMQVINVSEVDIDDVDDCGFFSSYPRCEDAAKMKYLQDLMESTIKEDKDQNHPAFSMTTMTIPATITPSLPPSTHHPAGRRKLSPLWRKVVITLAAVLVAGVVAGIVALVMYKVPLPTTTTTTPQYPCFVDRNELDSAIERYLITEDCRGNNNCAVGKEYGFPINTWCVSNIKDMSYLFSNRGGFNDDLSSWDVSSVTNMDSMFWKAYVFNGDLSSWNVSSVTNMYGMFEDATAFNGDLSNWDVSSVADMIEMFYGATAFNGDLSSWDVSSATDMSRMFYGTYAFNGDLSSWDVSSVTDMSWMFCEANAFNQDLCAWAGSFPYSSATNIFSNSGCTFKGTPQSSVPPGPFCASSSC
jgi:surface protein